MAVAFALPLLSAQSPGYRPPPRYVSGGKADQAEGSRILNDFKLASISGTYWLEFELRIIPRKGADRTVAGEMLGTGNDQGPLTRLVIGSQRWLIQTGPQPAAWNAGAGREAAPLSAAETLNPIAGTDLTLFDLQLPFLYWKDFVYEGLARVRGRPAHSFVLYPPAGLADSRRDLTGVRVFLDTQFQALVQAELLGTKGGVEKTISILDLKKVGEQWIPRSIDFRNNVTKDKTRLTVTAAALDLSVPEETFTPDQLSAPAPLVPSGQIERF